MTLQLQIEPRDIFGKKLGPSREEGKLPVVLYGAKEKTTPLFVSFKDFKKVWKEAGESTLVELQDESKKVTNVLIHDVAIDPTKNEPIHVDFYAVEMDKLVTAEVPLAFEGVSPAEKELGGVLVKVMHTVEVEALPSALPHELKVDISKLATFKDQITVKNIDLPSGVKILAKTDEVVALVELPKEEIEEEKISIEDVEVEKKGKKEEEGEAEGEKTGAVSQGAGK